MIIPGGPREDREQSIRRNTRHEPLRTAPKYPLSGGGKELDYLPSVDRVIEKDNGRRGCKSIRQIRVDGKDAHDKSA